MIRVLRWAAAALLLAGLCGCVVAPAPAPGYAYAPAPYYGYYGPPVAVGVGGCWGCGHWR